MTQAGGARSGSSARNKQSRGGQAPTTTPSGAALAIMGFGACMIEPNGSELQRNLQQGNGNNDDGSIGATRRKELEGARQQEGARRVTSKLMRSGQHPSPAPNSAVRAEASLVGELCIDEPELAMAAPMRRDWGRWSRE